MSKEQPKVTLYIEEELLEIEFDYQPFERQEEFYPGCASGVDGITSIKWEGKEIVNLYDAIGNIEELNQLILEEYEKE